MRNKLTIILFGLLLAVGWTGDASAQLKATRDISSKKKVTVEKTVNLQTNRQGEQMGEAQPSMLQKFNAPRRSNNYSVTAPAVRSKAQFEAMGRLSWTDVNNQSQSTLLTEPYTDPNGMMALVREIYTNRNIPGIKYSAAWGCDVPYQTIQFGWDIIGTNYSEGVTITANEYAGIYEIDITDANDNVLFTWDYEDYYYDGVPSDWTVNGTLTDYQYLPHFVGEGSITIPASYLQNSNGYAKVVVWSVNYYSEDVTATLELSHPSYGSTSYTVDYSEESVYSCEMDIPGAMLPPYDNGYTVMLVKLRDDVDFTNKPYETNSEAELRSYFQTYVKEVQLLADGYRVGSGENAGTLFSYSGDLNRFYFISKGKMFYYCSIYPMSSTYYVDNAPFYSMYEEFSPTTTAEGAEITDFYARMQNNESYPIVHDCRSVAYQEHYFSMAGKDGTAEHEVNSLVFFIPDHRGQANSRNYVTNHQPRTGLYVIDITPTVQSTASPDYYNVHVTWDANLDDISGGADVPQTYHLFVVYSDGTEVELTNPQTGTTYTYFDHNNLPAGDPAAYPVGYYVIGTPTGSTNPDFTARSKTKWVTIPGKNDFIGLTLVRHESDYMPNVNKNYYRNFLYPMNLEALGGNGVTKDYVGTEGRSLVLKRDGEPVIKLELIMDGTKAYYRLTNVATDKDIEPGYGEDGNKTNNNSNN